MRIRRRIQAAFVTVVKTPRAISILQAFFLAVAACSAVSAGKITYSVSGKVCTSDTGEGVAGVGVKATRVGQEGLDVVKTDAHGVYRIDGILPGPCSVTLAPDGGFVVDWRKVEKKVHGLPEQEVQGVDFALLAGVSVSGRVQDPSGSPISGRITAGVPKATEKEQYRDAPCFDLRATATSGPDGTFLLRGYSEGQTISVTAEHPGNF